MDLLDNYKMKSEISDYTKKDVIDLLEMIISFEERIEELETELENKKRDPKLCSCGWRGYNVIKNGGRCDSCM